MKISIALATYNGEMYLREQLASYLAQTRLPDELVVCDDVSSDETLQILYEFQKNAPFEVIVIKNPKNLGYAQNFGNALSHCKGDILLFSDQDDVWLPNKIKVIEDVFCNNDSLSLVVHDGELVNSNVEKSNITKHSQIIAGGFKESAFATGTLMAVKSDILPLVLPFPKNLTVGHDEWVYTIATLVNRKLIIDDVLQKIRRHEENTSQWIVNSLTKISKVDKIISQMKTTPATSYNDRISLNRSLHEVFQKVKEQSLKLDMDFDAGRILSQLDKEYSSILRRQELVSLNWFKRKTRAFDMLFKGEYKNFNGIHSFIRDILR